jgi:hypothetical protein
MKMKAAVTSRPESGSSKMIRSGLCRMPEINRTFCRIPFEMPTVENDAEHAVKTCAAARQFFQPLDSSHATQRAIMSRYSRREIRVEIGLFGRYPIRRL